MGRQERHAAFLIGLLAAPVARADVRVLAQRPRGCPQPECTREVGWLAFVIGLRRGPLLVRRSGNQITHVIDFDGRE